MPAPAARTPAQAAPRPAPRAPEPPALAIDAPLAPPAAERTALPAAITLADLQPAGWIDLFRQLPLTGVARNIAANSTLLEVSGKQLTLLLEDGKATLYNDEHRKRIEAAFTDYFATPVQLRVDIGTVTAETPAAWRARREAERREAARKAFTDDALVRAVVERFGAEIQYDSIASLAPDTLH